MRHLACLFEFFLFFQTGPPIADVCLLFLPPLESHWPHVEFGIPKISGDPLIKGKIKNQLFKQSSLFRTRKYLIDFHIEMAFSSVSNPSPQDKRCPAWPAFSSGRKSADWKQRSFQRNELSVKHRYSVWSGRVMKALCLLEGSLAGRRGTFPFSLFIIVL